MGHQTKTDDPVHHMLLFYYDTPRSTKAFIPGPSLQHKASIDSVLISVQAQRSQGQEGEAQNLVFWGYFWRHYSRIRTGPDSWGKWPGLAVILLRTGNMGNLQIYTISF